MSRSPTNVIAPPRAETPPATDQRWLTFVHNHARAIVACDFLTVVYRDLQVPLCLVTAIRSIPPLSTIRTISLACGF